MIEQQPSDHRPDGSQDSPHDGAQGGPLDDPRDLPPPDPGDRRQDGPGDRQQDGRGGGPHEQAHFEQGGSRSPGRAMPDPQAATARWIRSDDRVALGVAGGIADALDLDPTVVRLVFVGLFLLDGVGLPLYILGALLMRGSPHAPPTGRLRWIAALVVGAITAIVFNGHFVRGPFAWYVVLGLVGIGLTLWPPPRSSSRRFPSAGVRHRSSGPPHWSAPGRGDSAAVGAMPSASGPLDSTTDPSSARQSSARQSPPRRRRLSRQPRDPSPLGRMTLALAMIVGVLVWLVNRDSTSALRWAFSWAALVCGLGLLVGVVVGRARWLIIPGALALVGAMLAGAVAGLNVSWADTGDRFLSASSPGELPSPVSVGAGSVHFDLSFFRGAGQIDVTVGAGDITITLASDAHIDLDATIGLGEIRTPGTTISGYQRRLVTSFGGESALAPATIHLQLHGGVGSITVETYEIQASLTPFPTVPVAPTTVTLGPAPEAPAGPGDQGSATIPPSPTVPHSPPTTGLGGGQ